MFLVNSRLGSFAAPCTSTGSPYPEVTDASLPSSLTQDDPFSLVYSTIPPVLVYGTVSYDSRVRRFSWKQKGTDSSALRQVIAMHSTLPGDLPPGINALCFRRPVNTDALIFPLRHAASKVKESYSTDISVPHYIRSVLSIRYYVLSMKNSFLYLIHNTQYLILHLLHHKYNVVQTEAGQIIN